MSARDKILGRLRGINSPALALPDVGNWYATHSRDEDLSLHPIEQRLLAGDPESLGTPALVAHAAQAVGVAGIRD